MSAYKSSDRTLKFTVLCMDLPGANFGTGLKTKKPCKRWRNRILISCVFLLFYAVNSSVLARTSLDSKEDEYARRLRHQKGQFARFKRMFGNGDGSRKSRVPRPMFDGSVSTSVTVPLDEPAYIHCKVKDLGTNSVTWIRKSDGHILTVDKKMFTNDERIALSYRAPSKEAEEEDWCLLIKYVKKTDVGHYICQLSTEPAQSFSVHLNVTAKRSDVVPGNNGAAPSQKYANNAKMLGPNKVRDGDSIHLSCEVELKESEPEHTTVYWAVNGTVIPVSEDRTKYRVSRKKRGNLYVHTLEVLSATVNDTGNYSCKAASAPAQSMLIQVNGCDIGSKVAFSILLCSIFVTQTLNHCLS